MIEIKFVNKIRKDKMIEALIESGTRTMNDGDTKLEILFNDLVTFWSADKNVPYDQCRYEETENGIMFRTEMSGVLPKIFYYHFPRTFKQDAYILFDRETYFYSFDEFLKIENGRVYKMKMENIQEIEYEIQPEDIREDILDMVKKSKR